MRAPIINAIQRVLDSTGELVKARREPAGVREGRTMNEEVMRKYLKKLLKEFQRQLKMLQSRAASTQRNGRDATAATIAHLEQRILEISKILEEGFDEDDSPGVRLEETPSFHDLILMKMERQRPG